MKKELIKLANHLDRLGRIKEADYIDALLKRYAAKEKQTRNFSFSEMQDKAKRNNRFSRMIGQEDKLIYWKNNRDQIISFDGDGNANHVDSVPEGSFLYQETL